MARIAGVDLPPKKRVEVGLTYIYGIGRTRSKSLLFRAGIDFDKKVGDRPRDRVYRAEPDRRRRRWHCDTDTPNGTGCACWPGPIVTRSGNAYVPSGRPNPISAHVETVPGTARQIRVRIAFKCYKKFAQRRSPRPKVHSTHQTNGGLGRESSHREATFRVREKPV